MPAKRKRYPICRTADLLSGQRKIVDLDGRSVGVFNVNGQYFALHNRCPHTAAPLCLGLLTGTTLPSDDFQYHYGREGYILRCAWHGWEFDIETGQSLFDPKYKARTFRVAVENENVVVYI